MSISQKVEREIRERCSNSKSLNNSHTKLNSSKSSIGTLKSRAIELGEPMFPIFNVYNDIYTDSMISRSISFNIQKELTNFCKKGKIQVDYNVFLNHMMEVIDFF